MLYHSDFAIQTFETSHVNRNAFSVILQNDDKKERKTYSVAYSYKTLLYVSSVLAMNTFIFSRNTINKNGMLNKLHCFVIIAIYTVSFTIIRTIYWRHLEADLPLLVLAKTFNLLVSFEIIYTVLFTSFGNSAKYITLLEIIENIDEHFGKSKHLFGKRRTLATVLSIIPIVLVFTAILFENIRTRNYLLNMLFCSMLMFLMVQGVIVIYFIIPIYGQIALLNIVLLRKSDVMSTSKQEIFKNGVLKKILLKISLRSVPTSIMGDMIPIHANSYCWLELMQIYDKISDCVHIFNKIYAAQILLMFCTWLISNLLAICRLLSPILKNVATVKTDAYYYFLINARPFIVAMMSEYLMQEWQNTSIILNHVLIHGNLSREYYSQVETFIKLLETKKLQLSAILCPVTITVLAAFAARVISYSVLMIQLIYVHH